jgi:hypothetical protein
MSDAGDPVGAETATYYVTECGAAWHRTQERSMEAQPLAQFQRPAQFVGADLVALDHLRLCLPIDIVAIERVEDEVGRVAGRPRAGDRGGGFRSV